MAHSSSHGSVSATLRRRSEQLDRRARRGQRAGAGIAANAVADEVGPGVWHRLTHGADGRHHRPRWMLLGVTVAYLGGLGIIAGQCVYRALVRVSPRIGRLWAWPWAVVAGALILVLALTQTPWRPWFELDRHFPVSLLDVSPWWALAGWQIAVALATVAAEIVAWGWAGVPKGAVAPPARNRDGTWRETRAKTRLDVGGEAPYEPTDYDEEDY
ncbi:hypothetical protein ND991_17980 [Gordonia sputi]|uniref:hypothetical protein n=1 Tax=Gordonia sputi TaxID=36823 RepID=UPI0020443634|nr:hypothetical protein [Gordonia sputi]MCM3897098.1 hypothetical protein [Gordonia sputi]